MTDTVLQKEYIRLVDFMVAYFPKPPLTGFHFQGNEFMLIFNEN